MVKNLPANAGDAGEVNSIPKTETLIISQLGWSGRSPTGGNATYSSILAWRIPSTEEPDGLQYIGSQESDMTQQLITTTRVGQESG